MSKHTSKAVILGALTFALSVATALADKTTYWTGSGGNDLWTTAANWSAGVPASSSNDYVYIGTNGVAYTVDMTGSGSPNIKNNHVWIENATITNGDFIAYDTSVGSGSLYASNTIFGKNSSGIGGTYMPATTLIDCYYNASRPTYVQADRGCTTYKVKNPATTYYNFALVRIRPNYGVNVSVTFDGGS